MWWRVIGLNCVVRMGDGISDAIIIIQAVVVCHHDPYVVCEVIAVMRR